MGISISKRERFTKRDLIQKISNVMRYYVAATLIYHIYANRAFDMEVFLKQLINFGVSPPFYFVALQIQLLICGGFIFNLFKAYDDKWIFCTYMLLLVIGIPVLIKKGLLKLRAIITPYGYSEITLKK